MSTMYTVQFSGVAVTAQQDLFEITSSATAVNVIHGIVLAQSTDYGDAQEEGLSILIKSGATTTGSGGTTPTAVPINLNDSAYGGVAKVNNTTKATAGTIVTHHADVWNVRSQFIWIPTPEIRLILNPSRRLTVELATTPADSITMNGTLYFERIG